MSFLPILTFHSLDDQAGAISFPPGVFRRGMSRLYENGYRTLDLKEAVLNLREKRSVPNRAFVITFDDGYQSVYSEAFPLLREYGMCATVFLTVGEHGSARGTDRLPSLGYRPMLSWEEIREMRKDGFIFGAHTLTHPDLTRLPFDRMETEIVRSKIIIEERLGSAVTSFAYPYGRYNPHSYAIAQQCFTCACSDELGLMTVESDPYALERVDAYYLNTDRLFEIMLSQWFPIYITARNLPRRIRRAVPSRGFEHHGGKEPR
jgi:peptidoglycan/xylan/chitin deacetylase (PgdA/CDA1 family)